VDIITGWEQEFSLKTPEMIRKKITAAIAMPKDEVTK
jgi:hypothetical protein